MAKNRSYGDRGTGYTPRIESVPGTKNEKNLFTVVKTTFFSEINIVTPLVMEKIMLIFMIYEF